MATVSIRIPEGMRLAAERAVINDLPGCNYTGIVDVAVRAAISWLISQNPEANESPEVGDFLHLMFVEPEVSDNVICEIGAVLRDRKIPISNFEVSEILKQSRKNFVREYWTYPRRSMEHRR